MVAVIPFGVPSRVQRASLYKALNKMSWRGRRGAGCQEVILGLYSCPAWECGWECERDAFWKARDHTLLSVSSFNILKNTLFMPLDGHSYLASYGWSGKGNGLRKGAISRPLAIPQKRNLAGLGKERDEAFPFWDQYVLLHVLTHSKCHFVSVFTAAAKSIDIKVGSDSESDVSPSW